MHKHLIFFVCFSFWGFTTIAKPPTPIESLQPPVAPTTSADTAEVKPPAVVESPTVVPIPKSKPPVPAKTQKKGNKVTELVLSAGNKCKTAAEKKCLADTINGEARNQGPEGMIIVAKTVMTRYARGYNGKSICRITDGASFHRDSRRPTRGGPVDIKANTNVKIATELGCKMGDMKITHFYKVGSKKPAWANKFPKAKPARIGKHYLFNAPMHVKADNEIELPSFIPDIDFADLIPPLFNKKESSVAL